MPTAKKAAVIDELADKLGRMNAAALIEYRGLTVAEIGDLRNQLRQRDVEVEVTKNTLLRTAAHRNDMTALDDLFSGPNAVAFIYGDEGAATKALNDYFRTARVGEIKAGILKGGRRLTGEQFAKLADLPNRQTLLAQIAGLLQSPLSQLATLFNAPAQQLAYALANFEERGGAAGVGIQAAAAPATDTTPTPVIEAAAPTAEAAAPTAGAAPPAIETVASTAMAAAPDAIAAPAAVESDVTGAEPAGALPTDAAAGEDMTTPPVVPDIQPSPGIGTGSAGAVEPVAPEDAEDGAVDQIASPGAAETPDVAGGQQASGASAALDATAGTAGTAATASTPVMPTTAPDAPDASTAAPESTPVRITSSGATGSSAVDASGTPMSSAPESEGSAALTPPVMPETDQAGSTLRFSASLPAQTHETVGGQQAGADPTAAPESEGSAS